MNLNLIKRYFFNLFGIIISRISGLGRDLVLANFFGAGIYSDMFFIMLRLPQLFRSLITEGVFNQSFLPHLFKARKKGAFIAKIFCKLTFISLIICIFVSIFAKPLCSLLARSLNAQELIECALLMRISIWFLFFIFIASFLGSLCNYKNRFFLPSCLNSLFNISCIISLSLCLYFSKLQALKISAFAISIGAIIQIIILSIYLRKNRLFISFLANFKKQYFKREINTKGFNASFLAGVLAASSSSIGSLIEFSIASSYANAAITYVQLSTRLYQLPLALLAIAFSQVLLPNLLNSNSKSKAISNYFWLLFMALFFAASVGFYFSDFIIWLLFKHGAFLSEQAKTCAQVLRAYIFIIVPLGLSKVFLSQLCANLKQKTAAIISACSVALNTIMIFILLPHLELYSFGLSACISASFLCIGYALAAGRLVCLSILKNKLVPLAICFMILCLVGLYYLKGFIYAFIQ